MAKLKPATTACKAKDPNKCKYHTAVRGMNEALSSGDYIKYEAAKNLAEQHINDKEHMFFFKQKRKFSRDGLNSMYELKSILLSSYTNHSSSK